MRFNKNNKGFTLIELLIVIAIIGLMASVSLVAVGNSRVKARDARRKSDLAQILKAIELFRANDPNNNPIATQGWWAQLTNTCAAWGVPSAQLAPTHMAKVPDDPKSTGPLASCSALDGWWYYYGWGYRLNGSTIATPGGRVYILCTKLENTSDPDYKTIPNPWNASWTLNYCINGG